MASGPIAERNQGKTLTSDLSFMSRNLPEDEINKIMFVSALSQYIAFIWFLDATIYVGGLDEKVTETLLWELFVQAGPVGKQTLMNSFQEPFYL